MKKPVNIIDLFAGPGGLGEGFSALYDDGKPQFKIRVSVEKEASAHATLTLRAFFRQFPRSNIPDEYYAYLRGEISKLELFDCFPVESKNASIETLCSPTALGEDNDKIDEAIKKALQKDKNWVLIGGPPCQAFSLVGRARNKGIKGYTAENDHRHFLYKEYLRIIAEFQPAIFVMENVKGMLSSKVFGRPIFKQILADLENPTAAIDDNSQGPKYRVYSLATDPSPDHINPQYTPQDFVIRAEKYGIPQTRHRVILLGIREDLDIDGKQLTLGTADAPTVHDVIGTMPKLRSGLSKESDDGNNWKMVVDELLGEQITKLSTDNKNIKGKLKLIRNDLYSFTANRGGRYVAYGENSQPFTMMPEKYRKWIFDKKITGFNNHETRGHIRQDLSRYLFCSTYASLGEKKSPRLGDFPEFLLPDHANKKSGHFIDRFKVQLAHKPASTITSHISKDGHYFIHYDPTQCRSLTVREAARVQTFPDNYFFEGNRTQQYVQVGNAVPPLLANKIASIVYNLIFDLK